MPSEKVTTISAASVTTCQLVTIRPGGVDDETRTDGGWRAQAGLRWSTLDPGTSANPVLMVMLTTLGMRPRISSAWDVGIIFPCGRWTGQQRCCEH